jgi:hypothetical protein
MRVGMGGEGVGCYGYDVGRGRSGAERGSRLCVWDDGAVAMAVC